MTPSCLVLQILEENSLKNYAKQRLKNCDLCNRVCEVAKNFTPNQDGTIPWINIVNEFRGNLDKRYSSTELRSKLSNHIECISKNLISVNNNQKKISKKRYEAQIKQICDLKNNSKIATRLCVCVVEIAKRLKVSRDERMQWNLVATELNKMKKFERIFDGIVLQGYLARHLNHIKEQLPIVGRSVPTSTISDSAECASKKCLTDTAKLCAEVTRIAQRLKVSPLEKMPWVLIAAEYNKDPLQGPLDNKSLQSRLLTHVSHIKEKLHSVGNENHEKVKSPILITTTTASEPLVEESVTPQVKTDNPKDKIKKRKLKSQSKKETPSKKIKKDVASYVEDHDKNLQNSFDLHPPVPHPSHLSKRFKKENSVLCEIISGLAKNFRATCKKKKIPWKKLADLYNSLPTTTEPLLPNELKSKMDKHFVHIRLNIESVEKSPEEIRPSKKLRRKLLQNPIDPLICDSIYTSSVSKLCEKIGRLARTMPLFQYDKIPWKLLANKHNEIYPEGIRYNAHTLYNSLHRHVDHIYMQFQIIKEISVDETEPKQEFYCSTNTQEEYKKLCIKIIGIAVDLKVSPDKTIPWKILADEYNLRFPEDKQYDENSLRASLDKHKDHIRKQLPYIKEGIDSVELSLTYSKTDPRVDKTHEKEKEDGLKQKGSLEKQDVPLRKEENLVKEKDQVENRRDVPDHLPKNDMDLPPFPTLPIPLDSILVREELELGFNIDTEINEIDYDFSKEPEL